MTTEVSDTHKWPLYVCIPFSFWLLYYFLVGFLGVKKLGHITSPV
jgi:hypothetical protein